MGTVSQVTDADSHHFHNYMDKVYSHLYFSQIKTSVMACNLKIMKLFRSPFVVTINFVIVQCDMSIDVLFQNKIARQGK